MTFVAYGRDLLKEPTLRWVLSTVVPNGTTLLGLIQASPGKKLGLLEILVSCGDGYHIRLREGIVDTTDFYTARPINQGGALVVYDTRGYEPGAECAVWIDSFGANNVEAMIAYQER